MKPAAELETLREGFVGQAFSDSPVCPICGSPGAVFTTGRNIDAGNPVEFAVRQCRECRHLWTDPMPTQTFLDYLYRAGSASVLGAGWIPRERLTIPERTAVQRELESRPSTYLELGPGHGQLYSKFLEMGWDCTGVEPGDWGQHLPGVVRSISALPSGSLFDVVVAIDVLEHLSDPVGLLSQLREFAAPRSRLYASFPNHESWRFFRNKGAWRMIRPLGHVQYFSRRSAETMVERSGFRLISADKNDMTDPSWTRPGTMMFPFVQRAVGDQWLIVATPT